MCGDIILIRSRRYGENRIQDAEVFIPQISEESLHLFQPHRARLRYWSFWMVSCLFWPCFVSLLAAVSSDSLNLTALKICSPYNLLEEQAQSLGYLATFIRKLS